MALAASALLLCATGADAKAKKPSGGSVTGDIVISKVFYSGSIRLNDATPKNYMFHQYVELYNNSADTLDVSGLYLAFPNSDSATNAWTAEEMQTAHKDSIVVKQIFQIPAEPTCLLDPGKSLVITNCAVDHSEIAVGNVNLSSADFEVKSTNKSYVELHNDAVPALSLIYSPTAALDFMNILNPGPSGVILLAADTKIDDCPLTYAKGKTTGNQYKIVPAFKTIDCVDIVKQKMGSDPASVAYDTVSSAVAKGADVVLIDTAGRLHNRIDLMNELTKIRNVIRKVVPDGPHEVLLVLDGSTGQNAFVQAKEFSKATDVTALAVTKLDGSAKGGVVVGIVDQFRFPIKFIGIGEGVDDLKVFDKRAFVQSLFSKEDIEK